MKGKKGLNIKALFANHIEKIGFGLIGLVVLGIWAAEFLGGAWARTKENPNVMLQDIERKKKEINASTWPADMQEKFALVNFQQQAASLLQPIDSSRYELSTTLFEPLNKPKEKAREPAYFTVEFLKADPGHVILARIPPDDGSLYGDEDFDGTMNSDDMTEEEPSDEDADIQRRDIGTNNFGDSDDVMEDIPTMLGGKARGPRRGQQTFAAPGAQPTGGAALAGQAKASNEAAGRGGKDSRTIEGQRSKGMFYVSVRGIFPLRQQLEEIRKALHLDTRMAARDVFEILDFELQRQTAAAGDDPWTKEWETLNIRYAKEVLSEIDGFDDEPFQMEVFDPVITMPLPMRMFGLWKDHATHPGLKNFQISPEEQQKLNQFRSRLMEEYEKMAIEEEKARGPNKGGFADDVVDMRQMMTRMDRANPRGMQDTMRNIGRDMGMPGANGRSPMSMQQMFSEITPDGRLLLFRYFDFDVQPGYAYRYRVKLKLMNPNYDRPVGEVVDRHVVEGEDRWSPMSKVSNAAVMPVSPTYFLKTVEQNPLADHSRQRRTIANVNIYEWHRELGTRVFSTIGLGSLGQFLGGKTTTTILDVAEPSMDDGEYVFSTDDMLLDLVSDPELDPSLHSDLKLKEPSRGMKTVALGLAAEAMVVGQAGDLRQLESDGESPEEKKIRQAAERERVPFKDLKKKDEELMNSNLDEDYAGGLGGLGRRSRDKGDEGRAFMRMGGPQASSNPLRRGGRGGANARGPGISPGDEGFGAGIGRGRGGNAPQRQRANVRIKDK